MNTPRRITSISAYRSMLLIAIQLALPMLASAQSSSADMQSMPGMDSGSVTSTPIPANPDAPVKPSDAMPSMSPEEMKGMDHGDKPGMDHGSKPDTSDESKSGMRSMSGVKMDSMQGGRPPPNARSPDYSDGIDYGSMKGMDMHDDAPLGMLLIDQLEAFHGRDANGQSWEAEGWYGNDSNKLWIRTEGERSRGKLEDGDVEALWNHNVATYWGSQLGVRQDVGAGRNPTWAAFGVQGLAPYWFQLETTGYVGTSGRTAARLRAEYELLFTQRLILQPEAEVNLYGKDDPARRIGSGLSDVAFGLRLRYELNRQFGPYIGVNCVRRIGTTAEYARQDGQPVLDRQILAGVRIWL
jgi:copper resistance protein B